MVGQQLHAGIRHLSPRAAEPRDARALQRARARLDTLRTALADELRHLLRDHGVAAPRGMEGIRELVPAVVEDPRAAVTPLAREILASLYEQLAALDALIARYDRKIQRVYEKDETCW